MAVFVMRNKKTRQMNTKNSKSVSKTTVIKCNRWLFIPLYSAAKLYFFLYGVKIKVTNKCNKQPKAPSVVLCNHGSFIDFFYAERILRKSYPNFIIARLYFYNKYLAWLLKRLVGFPKSMFAQDLESTKNTLKVLNENRVLAMMPEARLSTVGKFEDIQENTYSFLKKCGVDVYTIKINGDYFANPKWAHRIRKGSLVEAELDILFTSNQVKELSVSEIKEAVESRLYYNEFEWLKTKPNIHYRSKRMAEGLENILTLCPVCKNKYTIKTKGKNIYCEHCGKLTQLDDRYNFTSGFQFENFADWYDWQTDDLKEQIFFDPDFSLCSQVELRLPSLDGKGLTRFAGNGVCTLTRQGLNYSGTKDGKEYNADFPIERIYRLLFGAGENFEVYNGTEIHYFVPAEKRSCVDWYTASKILNDLKEQGDLLLTAKN